PKLNRELFASGYSKPGSLSFFPTDRDLPEKVLQFGEGNFLRGFADWMINRLNAAGKFGGRVVVVQPIAQGLAEKLNSQDGLYTLLLRGMHNGSKVDQREIIDCISRALNPYGQWEQVLDVARSAELRVIVSNTTEAGITYRAEDRPDDAPPASFPGKLTRLLFERYQSLGGESAPGLIILPCELIERNGDALRTAVRQTSVNWSLPQGFLDWTARGNIFANTLVDRIVSGYPKDDAATIAADLGYDDGLLVAGEPFHFWVIEAPEACSKELPFDEVGLNVVFTDNMTPYRDRKVRILNGAHTMTVPAAFLMGMNFVGEIMDDPMVRSFMIEGIAQEIIPTLDLPRPDLQSFAAAVVERFGNPFVKHALLSITLNSSSKFKSRIVPSIKRFAQANGTSPKRLAFSLAALIAFYRGAGVDGASLRGRRGEEAYAIQDDAAALKLFATAWAELSDDIPALVNHILSAASIWGEDLSQLADLSEKVTHSLQSILRDGARGAMQAL
ncbi:MAG TPA: tagaturonate reductase, partial [Tepidisphaeraceae bacterium]|nr:tagaturonate reductase [Tepidisphaeraceae bacterium]